MLKLLNKLQNNSQNKLNQSLHLNNKPNKLLLLLTMPLMLQMKLLMLLNKHKKLQIKLKMMLKY